MLNIISKSNHKTRWCYLAHHGRKHLNILSGLFHVINRYLINQPFHLFLILVDSGNEICKLFLQNVPYFDVRAYSWNKNTTPNKIFTQFDWFCVISNKMIIFRIKCITRLRNISKSPPIFTALSPNYSESRVNSRREHHFMIENICKQFSHTRTSYQILVEARTLYTQRVINNFVSFDDIRITTWIKW